MKNSSWIKESVGQAQLSVCGFKNLFCSFRLSLPFIISLVVVFFWGGGLVGGRINFSFSKEVE